MKEWSGKQLDMRFSSRKNYIGAPLAGPGILERYNRLLKKAVGSKKNFKALVLGATPELLDLVLRQKGELTVCDSSLEAIIKSQSSMQFSLEKAILVKSDWLKTPLKRAYYDVILGDMSFLNVPRQSQAILADKIRFLLKENGFVLIRNLVINPDRAIQTVTQVNADFTRGEIHHFDAFINLLCYSNLYWRNNELLVGKYSKELKKWRDKKIISHKLFGQLKNFRPIGVRVVLPRAKFEKILRKYFVLESIPQAPDFEFSKDTIIFFFGRVKKKRKL